MEEPIFDFEGVKFLRSEISSLSEQDFIGKSGENFRILKEWISGADYFLKKTSGSTGKPKVIRLSRKQLEASARATVDFFDIQKGDVIYQCLNPEYIAGMMSIIRADLSQAGLIFREASSNPLEDFSGAFHHISMVPLQFKNAVNAFGNDVFSKRACKSILLGGAALNRSAEAIAQNLSVPVFHSYGMTETASHVALRKVNGSDRSDYFEVLPGHKIALDDRGCLKVCGPNSEGAWLETNDLAELKSESQFKIHGRTDTIINSGGLKIAAEALENEIKNLDNEFFERNDFIITPIKDLEYGQRPVMIFNSLPEINKIKELLMRLDSIKRPKSMLLCGEFSFTQNGKINRLKTLEKCQTNQTISIFP